MRLISVVVVVGLLSGCGEGAACDTGATCENSTSSLWCEDGKFVKYLCTGPSGCSSNGQTLTCDFRGSGEGTNCPFAAKGKLGFCATSTRFIECIGSGQGKWTGRTCSSCVTNANGTSSCVP